MSHQNPLQEGQILTGSLFSEPMRVETVRADGPETWVVGLVGMQSERFRKVTLTSRDLENLTILEARHTYDVEARHDELLQRRERRRKELEQQRALSLQAVERIASALVLSHPNRETPEVQQLKPNSETEAIAMRAVMEYERAQGRQVYDVHEKNLGYDLTSLDLNAGELRLIEVKGLAGATGTILLTPNERRVAEDRRDCYWLYIVTHCATEPRLQEPIKDPARFSWHEVTQVAHYYLSVDALTKPMHVREALPPYGGQKP